MSNRCLNFAWQQVVPGGQKLVLLALADHADREGVCWPSVDHLASRCGLTRRTVRKAVAALETAGLVAVERRRGPDGRQLSSVFRLVLPGDNSPPDRVKNCHPDGVKKCHPDGVKNFHPDGVKKTTAPGEDFSSPLHYEPSNEPPASAIAEKNNGNNNKKSGNSSGILLADAAADFLRSMQGRSAGKDGDNGD